MLPWAILPYEKTRTHSSIEITDNCSAVFFSLSSLSVILVQVWNVYIHSTQPFEVRGWGMLDKLRMRQQVLSICAMAIGWANPLGVSYLVAAEPVVDSTNDSEVPRIRPKSPEDSLKLFRSSPGFRVELVAAEPLIRDPVAIEFDARGRMFVVEAPEYNQYGARQKFAGHAAVKRLVDVDGDGIYDRSTVFVDQLNYATALACYGDGVFIGVAPDILYCRDTDDDGRADTQQVVFTGFGVDRAGEGQLNSIRWGLDNRFHMSTNLGGGDVRAVLDEDSTPRSVSRRRFIFDPRELTRFELSTLGSGQHGMSFDDWGRTYVCSNGVPIELLMYDDRYLKRNSYVAAPSPSIQIAEDGKHTRLFRISPPEPWRVARTRIRAASDKGDYEGGSPFGFFTAATGVTVYRGDAWPDDYRGNILVGEPANNLIYRARLEADGLGQVARRADPEAELLASTDIWFRPVQFAHGPEGALYVIDMYRELIEGADFLPPEVLELVDSGHGAELGRIYRILPEDFRQPRQDDLGAYTTVDLVSLLDSKNGWIRDTASRLLYERQDALAVEPLRRLADQAHLPQGRLHAMYALDGLGRLTSDVVQARLDDTHPQVRHHAVRLAERAREGAPQILAKLTRMVGDPEITVRYQLAFSIGELPEKSRALALAGLARRDPGNIWMELALQTSMNETAGEVLVALAGDPHYVESSEGLRFLKRLAAQIGQQQRKEDLGRLAEFLSSSSEHSDSVLSVIIDGLGSTVGSPLARQISDATDGQYDLLIEKIVLAAAQLALDGEQSTERRVNAIGLVRLGSHSERQRTFATLLEPSHPVDIQNAVVDVLAQLSEDYVPHLLIESWASMSPVLRGRASEVLFSRSQWLPIVLDAIESKIISASDIDPARRKQLTDHKDEALRSRAEKLVGEFRLEPRKKVLDAYREVVNLAGDRDRGKMLFKKHCSVCHRLEGIGHDIAPNLITTQNHTGETILYNVLAPNREVDPRYVNYILVTEEGRILTGVIVTETPTSVTLKRGENATDTVLRRDIEELRSTGKSLMPEGIEKQIDPQAMADVIAYVKGVK